MKGLIAVVLSLIYMFAVTLFLCFAAIFVCDGYYPLGWRWKGLFLHVVFWAMPLSALFGSIAASLRIQPRIAVALLLLGTCPLIAAVLWADLGTMFPAGWQTQSPWLHLRLLVVLFTLAADTILIRLAFSGETQAVLCACR